MKSFRVSWIVVLVVVASRAFNAHAQAVTNLHSFAGYSSDGSTPVAGLVQGIDGNFYGTTFAGGTSTNCGAFGCGTVFQVSRSGSYADLYSFTGSPTDGQNPEAGLVQGIDTNFYGTTHFGGTNNLGTIFRVSPGGTYTSLYAFAGTPNDGEYPDAGLVQGVDSNFYGTTSFGGANNLGTVFRISPSGGYTNLYSFAGPHTDGAYPFAGLVQGIDSNYYGTTRAGGANNFGTVFRISTNGTYASIYSFAGFPRDGQNPVAGLVQGIDSNFYGTTQFGGTSGDCIDTGCGTIFRISPSGSYTSLYSFGSTGDDGQNPNAGLVQGTDTNFYGTTAGGGKYDNGTVFLISPSGSYSNVYSFGSISDDGRVPQGGVIQGVDSNFYGTTENGGANNLGAVFGLGGTAACTYTVAVATVKFSIKGGTKNLRVKTTGIGCEWTAVSNDPFITITSAGTGTGNGTVDFSVPGNTNTVALSGTMTIAGVTVTIDQVAGGCKFSVSPKRKKFKAEGGLGTIKVKPNLTDCDWTAVSNEPFITLLSGTNGVGKGAVTYSVAANTNTVPLIGTITIGGTVFPVTQSGAK